MEKRDLKAQISTLHSEWSDLLDRLVLMDSKRRTMEQSSKRISGLLYSLVWADKLIKDGNIPHTVSLRKLSYDYSVSEGATFISNDVTYRRVMVEKFLDIHGRSGTFDFYDPESIRVFNFVDPNKIYLK